MIEKNNIKKKNWKWDLQEVVNSYLSEKEISNLVNKKLAYIIIELEHNPVSYIKINKLTKLEKF